MLTSALVSLSHIILFHMLSTQGHVKQSPLSSKFEPSLRASSSFSDVIPLINTQSSRTFGSDTLFSGFKSLHWRQLADKATVI